MAINGPLSCLINGPKKGGDSVNTARLSVEDAAKLMGVTGQFIRVGLQQGVLPFGYAVKRKRWMYYISPAKFTECTGIEIPEKR